MNGYGEELPRCYFHPRQIVVGICSLCLRERLLSLAAKQGHQHQAKDTHRSFRVLKGKLTIYLPRFFVLSSILHRFRFQHQRTNDSFNEDSDVASQDSFMTIEFDNEQHGPQGHERSTMKASLKLVDSTTSSHQAMPWQYKNGGNVVEYEKQPGVPRWRKRIGRLFKLARWKMATRQAWQVEGEDSGEEGLDKESLRRRTTSKQRAGRRRWRQKKRHNKLPP